jgi:hypothetical protein
MRPSPLPILLADPNLPPRLRAALDEVTAATRPSEVDAAKRRAAVLLALAYQMPWKEAAELVDLAPETSLFVNMRPAVA